MDRKTMEYAAHKYGTPAYIFDMDILKNRVEYIKESLGKNTGLCFAMKANPFIIKTLSALTERLEVCSPGEFSVCVKSGIPMEKLVISGVYKNDDDTQMMLRDYPNIGTYTAESVSQWEILKKYSEEYGRKIKVLLRLTSGNQFGMTKDEMKEILRENNDFASIVGIQYFSGTQKTSLKRLTRETEKINEFLSELKSQCNFVPKELEYGPGLPVSYFREDKEFNEKEFLCEFKNILEALNFDGKLTLELGRFITASCGVYLTKAVDIKSNRGQTYCITDGGMNHISYYGQSMAMKIPYMETIPDRSGENEHITICGALCTVNDILVKQYPVSEIHKGDVFVFKNTGAYCMTEGISLFLTRALPRILTYSRETGFSVIREQTPTDFLNTSII